VLGADHLFDFTDDPIGQQPAYVSTPWQQTGVQVVATDWATDGRALQIDPYGTSAFFAAVFDPVPAAADVELVARIRDLGPQTAWDWMSGVGARIAGTGQAGTGVLTQTAGRRPRAGPLPPPPRQLRRVPHLLRRPRVATTSRPAPSATRSPPNCGPAPSPTNRPPGPSNTPCPANPIGAGNTAITRYFGQHTTQLDYLAVTILDTPDPNPEPEPGPEPGPLRIMPVGDSITAGVWGAPNLSEATYRYWLHEGLVDAGFGFDFVGPHNAHPSGGGYFAQGTWDHDSFSTPGWRVSNMGLGIHQTVTAYDPQVLLVLIGINDLLSGGTPEAAALDLESALLAARAASPTLDLLVAKIPPAGPSLDESVRQYNGLVESLTARLDAGDARARTVDLFEGFDRQLHSYDDLHPNATGEQLIADRWLSGLSELYQLEPSSTEAR
jgi:acyl-CoA thioesterase I